MSESIRNLFAVGSQVELIEFGHVIDTCTVVSDRRSEITLKSLQRFPGEELEFAVERGEDSWKMLFDDIQAEQLTSKRSACCIIRLALGVETLLSE